MRVLLNGQQVLQSDPHEGPPRLRQEQPEVLVAARDLQVVVELDHDVVEGLEQRVACQMLLPQGLRLQLDAQGLRHPQLHGRRDDDDTHVVKGYHREQEVEVHADVRQLAAHGKDDREGCLPDHHVPDVHHGKAQGVDHREHSEHHQDHVVRVAERRREAQRARGRDDDVQGFPGPRALQERRVDLGCQEDHVSKGHQAVLTGCHPTAHFAEPLVCNQQGAEEA
mmetsp:Transcript_47914/g.147906  ORF Transcript_47914/g.147906 Transcript_47914/m.147906 type:complete len:224 (-) Transcript_47914:342-1013(-)